MFDMFENKEDYIEGTTSFGYPYKIKKNNLTDWKMMKLYAKLQRISKSEDDDGEANLEFFGVLDEIECQLFDDKGKSYEKYILKHNNGYIAPQIALEGILEILKSSNEVKNS